MYINYRTHLTITIALGPLQIQHCSHTVNHPINHTIKKHWTFEGTWIKSQDSKECTLLSNFVIKELKKEC